MKRLLVLLGLIAALALSVGAATVFADHGSDDPPNHDMSGGAGDDDMNGNAGSDDITGDAGNDDITGGKGNDVLAGNRGRDTIHARDGRTDRINCGKGEDTVKADDKDKVASNCEHVQR